MFSGNAAFIVKLQQALETDSAEETMSALDELGLKEGETSIPTPLAELAPDLLSLALAVSHRKGGIEKGTFGVIVDRVIPFVEPKKFAIFVSLGCEVQTIADCEKLSRSTRLLLFSIRSALEESKEALWRPSSEKQLLCLFPGHTPTIETVRELCEANLLPRHMICSFLATCIRRPEAPVAMVSTVSCFAPYEGTDALDALAGCIGAIGNVHPVRVGA